MTTIESCIDEVLKRGLDDWIQAAEVASVVQSIAGQRSNASIRRITLEVIETLIQRGLMRAGEVTREGFYEWDLTADQALEKIVTTWNALGRLPELGEVCWLSNTAQGDSRARSML